MNTHIKKEPFGQMPDGRTVNIFTLTNPHGMEVRITNYGGTIVSLKVPDRKGNMDDVVLGFDTFPSYLSNTPHFGSIIGRYGNRIAGGQFSLDGETYFLPKNHGPNTLHGGDECFDTLLWEAKIGANDNSLTLRHTSPDGHEGFPGKMKVTVVYTLTNLNELRMEYSATTDRPTVVNLTNHAYFNLTGNARQSCLDHEVQILAERYMPVNEVMIPTGELLEVARSPFDFRQAKTIGKDIEVNDEQIKRGNGYDHCWVIHTKEKNREMHLAASVFEPTSGRTLDVLTTEPGIQFYTGNWLGGIIGKDGVAYQDRSAFCLETQHFPDSPNQPHFPSTVLRPGEEYRTTTVYRFGAR